MSEPRIRRFSRFQIAFHWLVTIPYLVLFATGALLMLDRVDFVHVIPVARLQRVHRWAGIALIALLVQLLIVGIASGSIRQILGDVLDWVRLRWRDVWWLFAVPFNITWPARFHLPHAGRYNAGQKLHGLFIVAALVTFSVTGVMMMLRPADLRPWIVHSWLFFGAAAFLALHLFLGLVNRPTRKALGGIFSGFVSRQYVREHHALTLEPGPHPPAAPHAVVSPRAIFGTALLILIGAGTLLTIVGPDRSAQRVARLARMDHPMIFPGPLAAAHADLAATANCNACHKSLRSPPDAACLACHEKVATVMQQHTGVHGRLTGACIACHTEHRGRDADLRPLSLVTFDHQMARFPLQGRHKELQCDQCHVQHADARGQRRFIGLRFASCIDCHANPHDSAEVNDCRRCHTDHGWTGGDLLFHHDRDARFKLDVLHAQVACNACHVQSQAVLLFTKLAISCEKCHHTITDAMAGTIGASHVAADPHWGRVRCTDCHAPGAAQTTPAQFADACTTCHTDRYRNLYFDWRRSIDERVASAMGTVKAQSTLHPAQARELSQRVTEAQLVGLHNVNAAIGLLDAAQPKAGTVP